MKWKENIRRSERGKQCYCLSEINLSCFPEEKNGGYLHVHPSAVDGQIIYGFILKAWCMYVNFYSLFKHFKTSLRGECSNTLFKKIVWVFKKTQIFMY